MVPTQDETTIIPSRTCTLTHSHTCIEPMPQVSQLLGQWYARPVRSHCHLSNRHARAAASILWAVPARCSGANAILHLLVVQHLHPPYPPYICSCGLWGGTYKLCQQAASCSSSCALIGMRREHTCYHLHCCPAFEATLDIALIHQW